MQGSLASSLSSPHSWLPLHLEGPQPMQVTALPTVHALSLPLTLRHSKCPLAGPLA